MKVLITSGPTREPIDSVRYISNFSSGQTGKTLSHYFYEQGFEIVSLYGQGSARPEKIQRTIEFSSFSNLDFLLQRILGEEKFDIVIHLAAVSDYSVPDIFKGKLESENDELKLILKKNFKILDRLKSYVLTDQKPLIVGFKLTDNRKSETWINAIQQIYARGQVDLVVHNDLSEYSEKNETHRFRIVDKKMNVTECPTILDLCQELLKFFRRAK